MLSWHSKPINETVVITNHTKTDFGNWYRIIKHLNQKFIWIYHKPNEYEQWQLKKIWFTQDNMSLWEVLDDEQELPWMYLGKPEAVVTFVQM
jgi:beta-lactamase superfamily II metal-dependent hydrolase